MNNYIVTFEYRVMVTAFAILAMFDIQRKEGNEQCCKNGPKDDKKCSNQEIERHSVGLFLPVDKALDC